MASKSKAPGAGDTEGPEIDSLNNCQNNLEALRVQYLKEVFALPSNTANVLAALAFGEVRS